MSKEIKEYPMPAFMDNPKTIEDNKGYPLSTIIDYVLGDDPVKENEISFIIRFLGFLEEEGVISLKNIHISKSSSYYNDLFFIRFFKTLRDNEEKAYEMLKLFEFEDLKPIVEYKGDNFGELIKIIRSFLKNLKRVYFDDTDVPFFVEMIRGIRFDFKLFEDKLTAFIDSYVDQFMKDELKNPHEIEINYDEHGETYETYGDVYYPYQTQKLIFLLNIKEGIKQNGYNNILFLGKLAEKTGVRKFETIMAMEREELIKDVIYNEAYNDFRFNADPKLFERECKDKQQDIKDLTKKIDTGDESVLFDSNNQDNLNSRYYDTTKVLKIQNREVAINKTGRDTDQTKLLKTIFENPKATWYADEIYESWSEDSDYYKGKNTLDNARRRINQKAIQAGLKDDFLEGNNQQIKINKDYL